MAYLLQTDYFTTLKFVVLNLPSVQKDIVRWLYCWWIQRRLKIWQL